MHDYCAQDMPDDWLLIKLNGSLRQKHDRFLFLCTFDDSGREVGLATLSSNHLTNLAHGHGFQI